MLPFNELFTAGDLNIIQNWYASFSPVGEKLLYRDIPPQKVKTVFYGDSITNGFQIHEFFPGASFKNRGISGDNLCGLYFRMDEDVFAFEPEQVILLAGINCIEDDIALMMKRYEAIGDLLAEKNIKTFFCSILPLRRTPECKRIEYQEKVIAVNTLLREMAERKFAGYIDYHSALKDANGELAEEYARPDGVHLLFQGYKVMADVLKDKMSI